MTNLALVQTFAALLGPTIVPTVTNLALVANIRGTFGTNHSPNCDQSSPGGKYFRHILGPTTVLMVTILRALLGPTTVPIVAVLCPGGEHRGALRIKHIPGDTTGVRSSRRPHRCMVTSP